MKILIIKKLKFIYINNCNQKIIYKNIFLFFLLLFLYTKRFLKYKIYNTNIL